MTRQTDLHNYTVPTTGDKDYDNTFSTYFDNIDRDVPIRDVESNLSNYTPKAGAKFEATDTENEFIGDGSSWNQLQTAGPNPSYESAKVATYQILNRLDRGVGVPFTRPPYKKTGGNGAVVFSYDDSDDSIYNKAFQAHKNKGVPGTFFVIENQVGTSGSVTWDQIREMDRTSQANGQLKTQIHGDTDWTTLTQSQLRDTLDSKIRTHSQEGINVRYLSYPFGANNTDVRQVVQHYVDGARTVRSDTFDNGNPYDIPGEDGSKSISTLESLMDNAKSNDSLATIFFHNIGSSGDKTQSELEGLIQYALNNNIPVVRFSEGIERFTPLEFIETQDLEKNLSSEGQYLKRQDEEYRIIEETYTDLGTTAVNIRNGAYWGKGVKAIISVQDPNGNIGAFELYFGFDSGTAYTYQAGEATGSLTNVAAGEYDYSPPGSPITYTFKWDTGVNNATIAAGSSTTGDTKVRYDINEYYITQ